jgi:ComF family protein
MAIDGIRSPFRFEGVIRQSVHDLKYHNLRAISGCLAELMASYLREAPILADVLVPVPIHLRRLRERGYNQSVLLARELGKLIDLPVVADCLLRIKDSLPQARTTNVEERQRNVSGAFACKDERLSGCQVLLIDDLSTSCTTLEACATALKSAGAFSVYGLTLAREILTKEIKLWN